MGDGFTPNFEFYFGQDALRSSKISAQSAWQIINNYTIGSGIEDLEEFKKKVVKYRNLFA